MEKYLLNIDGLGIMELKRDAGCLTGSRWATATPDYESNSPEKGKLTSANFFSIASREINEYLRGERRDFTLPVSPKGTPFQTQVWEEIRKIPYGETISYKELAMRIGSPGASRAVANACGANPLPLFIPCHRVVASGGKTGGYTGGTGIKLSLLNLEQKFLNQ